jgi:hypothetical protein
LRGKRGGNPEEPSYALYVFITGSFVICGFFETAHQGFFVWIFCCHFAGLVGRRAAAKMDQFRNPWLERPAKT